jgi:hypothetical protein
MNEIIFKIPEHCIWLTIILVLIAYIVIDKHKIRLNRLCPAIFGGKNPGLFLINRSGYWRSDQSYPGCDAYHRNRRGSGSNCGRYYHHHPV